MNYDDLASKGYSNSSFALFQEWQTYLVQGHSNVRVVQKPPERQGTKGSISFEANLIVLVLEALTSW